ncbi:MAG: UrcA family protein [Pseudomonadota bacterium]
MRFTLPLVALAALATPTIAAAQPSEDIVTVAIAYGDIDLTTEQGRAALEQRVDESVRKACTVKSKSRYALGRDVLDNRCIAEARAAALAEVERLAAAEMRGGRQAAAN